MYLVESFPNTDALERALQYSKEYGKSHENKEEEYEYCLLRERGNEIRVAKELGVTTVIEFTHSGVSGILDLNWDKIDISPDLNLLQEEWLYIRREFIKIFWSKTSTVSLPWKDCITQEEKIRIRNWPKYINPAFTERNISLYETLHFEDIYDAFDESFWFRFPDGQEFPFPIFIKTIRKNCSAIIRNPKDFNEFCMGVMTYTGFIISDIMNISKDEYEKQEYRIYIVNGKSVNASRYVDYDTKEVPTEVFSFAQKFSDFHKNLFSSYVLDIAFCEDGKYRVVELNNLSASGRYRSNDFDKILCAIMDI